MNNLNTSALALAAEKSRIFKHWGKFGARKRANVAQQTLIYRHAKKTQNPKDLATALKAAGSLYFCNRRVIVEKQGNDYTQAGAWYCGKKYCSFCSNRKRRKLLTRFTDFFTSKEGAATLELYDLALFTVTLQHSKTGQRADPYYKELSTHWRNGLKYGAFKTYIKGGFYNTEHTYSNKNGHHIHRHALILVPRIFDVSKNFKKIETELREQWKSRTGGSFQIDLRPLGYSELHETAPPREQMIKNINLHLLEVTKYITKRDDLGTIKYEIIKAVEENSRSKFYGRFGVLHKIKALNLNLKNELEIDVNKPARELYIGTPVLVTKKINNEVKGVIKNKSKTTSKGIDTIKITTKQGQQINRFTREVVKYKIINLVPMADTPEAFKEFTANNRNLLYDWGGEKWNTFRQGYHVEKWKQSKKNNFTKNEYLYGEDEARQPFIYL